MANQGDDPIVIRITGQLQSLSPTSSECCIVKIPSYLRMVNERGYEPEVLAIGPYHRHKDHLKATKDIKFFYLQRLLQRKKEIDASRYVVAMRALVERARECYAGPLDIDIDDFVEMMVLDGCFIVQLICKFTMTALIDDNDPVFNVGGLWYILCRDMLLLENQLPLFVLWELFGMIEFPNEEIFIDLIFKFLSMILPVKGVVRSNLKSIRGIRHLLDFIHCCWSPSPSEMDNYRRSPETRKRDWSFIRCATELQEAGIKFSEGDSLFDVKFESGVLKIPTLKIGDYTECLLRNLIALEQIFPNRETETKPNHVTDYIKFMDCLINSPKDVEILRRRGVIDNWLGSDEAVATMFNRISDSVGISSDNFYYAQVFNKVNIHCSRSWNKWMANLKHDYFNSPWTLVSVLAAVLLLLLTLLQTAFTILSYVKPKT